MANIKTTKAKMYVTGLKNKQSGKKTQARVYLASLSKKKKK